MKWRTPGVNGKGPCARGGHACVSVDGCMYVFGGANREDKVFNDLYRYNPESVTWYAVEATGDIPPQRSGASMVHVEGMLYLFGGRESQLKENACMFNDVHAFDIATSGWSKLETAGGVPESRNSHSACVNDGKVYVFGGANGGGPLNDLCILDTGKSPMEWTVIKFDEKTAPQPREMHSAAIVGGRMMVLGGRGFEGVLNDYFLLDLETLGWSRQKMTPFSRCAQSCCATENLVYVVGGFDGQTFFSDVHVLDIADAGGNHTWRQPTAAGVPPSVRFAHSQVLIDGAHYIFGGINIEKDHDDLVVLEEYSEDGAGEDVSAGPSADVVSEGEKLQTLL